MQKGDQKKLRLLLGGIVSRLEKNKEYFISVDFQFTSGKKTFEGQVSLSGDTYCLHFQGMEKLVTAAQIADFFQEEAARYEQAVMRYTERTTVLTLASGPRGIQFSQSEPEGIAKQPAAHTAMAGSREYLIRIDQASALLKEIGILTAEGKLKNDMIRKYNQIDHYVELVAPMFEKDDSEEILLLDCACGKSYLSFVMNYYLCEVLHRRCRIIGIDINPHVVEESRKMAERLSYRNMEFIQADLRTYEPPKQVTAVISLHACDIATDLALATAIAAKAKYIACVPCCHKELLEQYHLPEELAPLTKYGVFKARMNDVLTDSMRALRLEAAGYQVSVVEYISPLDTPKNLLIRGTYTGKPNEKMKTAYDTVRKELGTYSELDRRCDAIACCGDGYTR